MAKRQSGLVTRGAAKAMGCEKAVSNTVICAILAAIICAERCRREASASIVSSEIKTHAWDAKTPDAHVRPSQGRPGTAGRGHHGAREPGRRSASHRGARRSPG